MHLMSSFGSGSLSLYRLLDLLNAYESGAKQRGMKILAMVWMLLMEPVKEFPRDASFPWAMALDGMGSFSEQSI